MKIHEITHVIQIYAFKPIINMHTQYRVDFHWPGDLDKNLENWGSFSKINWSILIEIYHVVCLNMWVIVENLKNAILLIIEHL